MIRRVLVGLSSLLGLLLIIAAVPITLLQVGFQPARAGIRTWADLWVRLSMPDDGTLISAVLTIAAWAAWAYLIVAIGIELAAMLRKMPAPRIPGLKLGQIAARHLVAGAALLFMAAPIIASVIPTTATAAPTIPPATSQTVTKTVKPAEPKPSTKTITVKKGDTLSELAQTHLGDAHKWPRIYKASTAIDQSGDRHLTDPDKIDIGWTLNIPQTKPKPATPTTPKADLPATPKTPPPPQSQAQAPAAPQTQNPTTTPSTSAASQAPSINVPEIAPATAELETDPVPMWAVSTGVGAVVAAGLISLLTYRRRRKMQTWRPGMRIPMPTATEATTEQELRAAAAPITLEIVDHALRALSRDQATTNTPLPTIRAARLSAERFELFLTDPARLPAPWRGTADGTVWLLDDVDTDQLPDEDLTEIPAPYPSLVTIGEDEEHSNVLVDLEHLGSLGILGNDEATREALAALAIELAVSPWADDLTVTVIGAFSELESSLQTGRVRYLPTIELAIADLEARTTADHQALNDAAVNSVTQARTTRVAATTWPPEILIIASNLTNRHHNLLTGLVEARPRVAIAAITGADTDPLGEWTLQLQPDRTAKLNPIGLTLTPQLVTATAYSEMLNLVAAATYDDLIPTPKQADDCPTDDGPLEQETLEADPATTAPPKADAHPSAAPQVVVPMPTRPTQPDHQPIETDVLAPVQPLPGPTPTIRILGPVEIENAEGPVEPSKRGRLLEYAIYLLLNPAATAADIDEAIWPDRARNDNTTTRNTSTSKLRRWLGQNPIGELYLPLNRYHLTGITSDWHTWQQLLDRGPKRASTTELDTALKLIRGRPFAGVHPRRYAWAEPARQHMTTEIVEVAYELGRRRLMNSDWRGVEAAVVTALAIEPALEHLWRLRILAAHHSGDTQSFEEAKARLLAVTDELGLQLEPETDELLTDLATDPKRAWEKAIAQ